MSIENTLSQSNTDSPYSPYSEDNLKAYSDNINLLASIKSDEVVANGLPEHAMIINSALLANAKKEICIFSSNLRNDIYGTNSVVFSLNKFLSKESNTKIRVILQDIDNEKSDIYKINSLSSLEKKRKFVGECANFKDIENKVQIKKCSEQDLGMNKHFTIMDESGYRYCPDKNVTEAIACFNDSETAMNLKKQFNILFERAIDISDASDHSSPLPPVKQSTNTASI